MIEKIWNVKSVEEKKASNGNPYILIVTLGDDGKDHKTTTFDQSMFQVFKNNKAVKVTLDKPEGATKWELKSAMSVADGLAPAVNPSDTPIPQQAELDKALDGARVVLNQPKPEPAPQAVGMITKEIGDMIRAKYLATIFGDEAQKELIRWYRSQTLGITRIPFDEDKLPKFE